MQAIKAPKTPYVFDSIPSTMLINMQYVCEIQLKIDQFTSEGDFSNCFSSSGESAILSEPRDEKLFGLGAPLTLPRLLSLIASRVRVYVGKGARY